MKKIARLIGFYLNVLALLAPRQAGRRGFYLACTPMAPAVKDRHREFFETGKQGDFELEGNRIHTYQWGTGDRKILFVHGWQSHSFRWRAYIESFVQDGRFTVYAMDAPAHGQSGGKYINLPLYSRAIDHFIMQIQPVQAVVGHSFGSFAMLYSLNRTPALPCARLVAMGTPEEVNDFMREFKDTLGLSDRAYTAAIDCFEQMLGHRPEYFSATKFASTITIPGFILHDRDDEETSYHNAERIHAAWPNSTLVLTKGLGHNMKSEEVMSQVLEFCV